MRSIKRCENCGHWELEFKNARGTKYFNPKNFTGWGWCRLDNVPDYDHNGMRYYLETCDNWIERPAE